MAFEAVLGGCLGRHPRSRTWQLSTPDGRASLPEPNSRDEGGGRLRVPMRPGAVEVHALVTDSASTAHRFSSFTGHRPVPSVPTGSPRGERQRVGEPRTARAARLGLGGLAMDRPNGPARHKPRPGRRLHGGPPKRACATEPQPRGAARTGWLHLRAPGRGQRRTGGATISAPGPVGLGALRTSTSPRRAGTDPCRGRCSTRR